MYVCMYVCMYIYIYICTPVHLFHSLSLAPIARRWRSVSDNPTHRIFIIVVIIIVIIMFTNITSSNSSSE